MGGGVFIKTGIPDGSGSADDRVELGGLVGCVQAEQTSHGVAGQDGVCVGADDRSGPLDRFFDCF